KVTDDLRQLADDMLETMYAENGIGLASIQVGVEKRLLVIDITPMTETDRYDLSKMTELEKKVAMPLVIFNPVITQKDGKTTYEEGCLSVPGYFETVQRANHIVVTGVDRDNNKMNLELDGLLAICMQHEIDHLDGKVFLDRLSPIKSARLKNKIKKYGYTKKGEEDASSEDGKNEL
ncbi:MAG: peptide deformylase, partial [Bdellovibrionaceae bacterium]|nr:peptide deformylase [Pseudobdellovibrionaceae bacterium]